MKTRSKYIFILLAPLLFGLVVASTNLHKVVTPLFGIIAAWTNTYNTATPAGTDDPREADDRMREIKAAVQEVMDVEHDWALTGTSLTGDGKHTDITCDSIAAESPWADVVAFGADDTGATPCSTEIKAALDSLTTEIGVLFFPPGDYLANNIVFNSSDTKAAPKVLLISGYGAKIINEHASNSTFVMELTGTDYRHRVFIEGLQFDGSGESTVALKMENFLNVKVVDCDFYRHKTAAIYATDCWHCIYDNVVIYGKATGDAASAGIQSLGSGGNVKYNNIYVRDCTLGVNSAGNHGGGGFYGCDFTVCGYGIVLTNGFATTIESCWFESNTVGGIYAGSTGAQKGLIIEGCHFGSGGTSAIKLNHVIGPIIRGNSSTGKTYFIATTAGNSIIDFKDIQYNCADDTYFIDTTIPEIASATALILPLAGDYFTVTGTTTITSIQANSGSWKGREVTLRFAGILTLTSGGNLLINDNMTTSTRAVIHLICDGTNWYEKGRSYNISSGLGDYTTTRVTEDRTYDADSTSNAEVADVLGTLIADLILQGVIK